MPCQLRNHANVGGHWTKKAGYQKRLREKTQAVAFVAAAEVDRGYWPLIGTTVVARQPKCIELTAYVWNYFDTHDGLRNALKPVVDGLVRARVIHSDAHACGHLFLYAQILDRKRRGVAISITPLAARPAAGEEGKG